MNITVLDGYTTNPGDLSWDNLSDLGQTTIYDRSPRETIASRLSETEIAVSNKVVWDAELFDQAPHLKMIALLSTGFNVVDLQEAKRRGVLVANVPAYSTPDVAQMTFALLLEITNQVATHAQSVKEGAWCSCPDFTYSLTPLIELSGKTLGIIGMGSIGQAVAKIAQAFDMKVLFANRSQKPACENASTTQVDLETLLHQADVISLHCPATPETENIINESTLALMKPGAIVLNTARGTLVDEAAMAAALQSGHIAAFGTDVVSTEPMTENNPLKEAPHTFITPHIAWATKEARQRLLDTVACNIKSYLEGHPQNIVSE